MTRAGIRAAAARYRHFPLYSTPSGLLNSLGTSLPAILLAALFDDTVAGLFALSQRVIAAPMLLVGRSVSQVYMGEAAELIKQRDFPALWRVYVRTARMSALVGAVPVALLAIGGPLLFGTIFGEQWAEAGAYVQVMSLMLVAQFVAAPVAQTLNLFERVGLQAVYDGVRLVLGNGALVAAWALGWDALAAVAAYSAAMFVSYCVNIVLNSSTIRRASASTLPGR